MHYTHELHFRHHHHVRAGGYSPPTASIVVDGNTGAVLEESNADAPRHPASLTKVMTLYLLFERLQAGTMHLDTPLLVSQHAADQAPTKLGLKPGQTISVDDAVKAIVTRSANDAAVVIAENIGGSEPAFARMMTEKARELGMDHTTYVNASGLPNDAQITTARDLSILGRAIAARFPQYFHFFSTKSFVFRGETIRGHDHLLGSVPGVDGMKTGFTDASGFNLLTSVHRDGRYLMAVVLGGRSAAERDAHMRALIASNIRLAVVRHRPPAFIVERQQPEREPKRASVAHPALTPAALARAALAHAAKEAKPRRSDPAPGPHAGLPVIVGSNAPIRPVVVKTISYRAVTVRGPSMKPMPVMVPVAGSEPAQPMPAPRTIVVQTQLAHSAPKTAAPHIDLARVEPVKPDNDKSANTDAIPSTPPHIHSGWVIQIGAFGGEDEARQHLNEAKTKLHEVLAAANPFTERVQQGDTTFYRARFAGFDRTTAEAACRSLKRDDFRCIALKD